MTKADIVDTIATATGLTKVETEAARVVQLLMYAAPVVYPASGGTGYTLVRWDLSRDQLSPTG